MKRVVPALAVLLVLLFVLAAISGCGTANGSSGGSAAAFSGMTMGGQQVSLDSYKGKPLVLVFWASW